MRSKRSRMRPSDKKGSLSGTGLAIVLLWGCLMWPVMAAAAEKHQDPNENRTITDIHYLLYEPAGMDLSQPHPMIIALSPAGSAHTLLRRWKPIAEQMQALIVASKFYRQGVDPKPVFAVLMQELEPVLKKYRVDIKNVIVTGFGDGVSGAHALAFLYPDKIGTVIADNGTLPQSFRDQKDTYPSAKRVVFIAHPSDSETYQAMKADEEFFKGLKWETKWIEYGGAQAMAPRGIYEQALAGIGGMPKTNKDKKAPEQKEKKNLEGKEKGEEGYPAKPNEEEDRLARERRLMREAWEKRKKEREERWKKYLEEHPETQPDEAAPDAER